MLAPALPLDENERLQALQALNILDTAPEERFDRLVRIARALFKTPIVLISLIDTDRQWFKSCLGLEVDSTPRDISFCGHAIHDDDILHIADAVADSRFADNPLVTGAPHIRFYAGAPLRAGGHRIGTLCLIDRSPRTLTPEERRQLRDLADAVEQQFTMQDAFEAARQINRHQIRLDAVFRTVPDGLLILTADGCIDSANPATGLLFGAPPEQLLNQPVQSLFDTPDRTAFADRAQRLINDNSDASISFEITGLRGNEPFPLELTLSRMSIDNAAMLTVIARDISTRRKLEKMKDEFISTVSHELRTPLTSIRGALGLILGKAADGLTPKAQQLLDTASRNAERLTLLINDILDLEKIASGRMEFEIRPIDIVALSRQALQAHEGYAARHQVRLRLHDGAPVPPVSADENRLMQVYANLLSNAIKYSPPGGEVEVSITVRHDRLRVGIRDHGRGIPASFRQTAFQRFAQADSSDTREKGGTGLGLSIVKAILDRHAGVVDYESTPGEGTLFYFELPLPPASTPAGPGGQRVLICEDNPDVAAIIAAMLADEGVTADIVGTAAEAEAKVNTDAYAVLLLDLTLPDRDGLLLLDDLRANPATRELPVIIVTGRADEDQGWRNAGMHVLDWLQKPVDRERLAAALHRVIRGEHKLHILHVEDEPDILQITRMLVEDLACYDHASRLHVARAKLATRHYDLVMLDISLPDGNGLDLIELIPPGCRILVFSGQEHPSQISRQVSAALIKSKTSNEHLRDTIKTLLRAETD